MLRSSTTRALVLAEACLLAISPFFWMGNPSGHDFEFHMYSWMEVLGQWKHGVLYPRWAALAHWGYGEARFLFYPPASWTLGAALGAVLPWKMVPGAYCWIVLTLAAVAMYRLAREWLPVPDALFAAVLYALNPYHLLVVYWRSAYAELLAAPLLPLVLLCLVRLKEPGSRPTLCLSLILAAAWLTNAPAAVMIHYSTVGLAILLAAQEVARGRSHGGRIWGPQLWRPLINTALAIVLGAGLASFYLLPATYEQGWVNLSQVLSPGVRPQDNFLFTTIADEDHNRFNSLVSTLVLVEIGVLFFAMWFARNRRQQDLISAIGARGLRSKGGFFADRVVWMQLSTWGAGSAILMVSVSNVLWQHFPELRFVQLPFRWLLCLNVALAMLVAMATKRWSLRVLAFVTLLGALLIAGHRIQPPWWDQPADIREMSDAMADGTGYEGTEEYVPAEVDPYEVKKELAVVSDEKGEPVRNEVLAWNATEKHFRVQGRAPQELTVRLFQYPAWEVTVNGKPAESIKADTTGLMVIPVAAGDSDIHIRFRRTRDRFIGNMVSLISVAVFVVVWRKPAWIVTRRSVVEREIENSAA